MLEIKEIDDSLRKRVIQFFIENWNAPKIVSRGKMHYIDSLPGYIVIDENEIKGLITYEIKDNECEIISLDSVDENKGIGSLLVEKVEKLAKQHNFNRIWLITTNDNIRAIRFYQKRGYDLKELHRFAVEKARELKPEIPLYGNDNIPIKHELEFEKKI